MCITKKIYKAVEQEKLISDEKIKAIINNGIININSKLEIVSLNLLIC